ncbi:hypothetical protein GGTG_04926 [Gaeumannomyces tritici R3-111a-1]|uniref:Uncharacterized protein n=1 Tax=Gaeumannomyces tritici (strain R3-111a-1) TaxID=644352 RepID=J3NUH0_GAET3|nr:hypothetical protein GGTG_04926 [Gaeumannomyces tritici R3-111a-1]EJT79843.1 hypothetical protein GGTG_04926 [Gaeumannomyces tritici R3-111a-1]
MLYSTTLAKAAVASDLKFHHAGTAQQHQHQQRGRLLRTVLKRWASASNLGEQQQLPEVGSPIELTSYPPAEKSPAPPGPAPIPAPAAAPLGVPRRRRAATTTAAADRSAYRRIPELQEPGPRRAVTTIPPASPGLQPPSPPPPASSTPERRARSAQPPTACRLHARSVTASEIVWKGHWD